MLKLADYRGRLEEIPFDFHEMVAALAPKRVLIVAPLRDSNFRHESVDRVVKAAKPIFSCMVFPTICRSNIQTASMTSQSRCVRWRTASWDQTLRRLG